VNKEPKVECVHDAFSLNIFHFENGTPVVFADQKQRMLLSKRLGTIGALKGSSFTHLRLLA